MEALIIHHLQNEVWDFFFILKGKIIKKGKCWILHTILREDILDAPITMFQVWLDGYTFGQIAH